MPGPIVTKEYRFCPICGSKNFNDAKTYFKCLECGYLHEKKIRCYKCGKGILETRILHPRTIFEKIYHECSFCKGKFIFLEGRLYEIEIKNNEIVYVFDSRVSLLRGSIKAAEAAYKKAVEILSNLQNEENRKILAEALRESKFKIDINQEFFKDGIRFSPSLDTGEKNSFHTRKYNLTLILEKGKWESFLEYFKDKFTIDKSVKDLGKHIPLEKWPFSTLDGINFVEDNPDVETAIEHEQLHGTFGLYRTHDRLNDLESAAERYILSEINARKADAKKAGWETQYYNIVEVYIKKAIKNYKLTEDQAKIFEQRAQEAIIVVKELSEKYDENVVERVLIKSRGFDDLMKWYLDPERRKQLDLWQARLGKIKGYNREKEKISRGEDISGQIIKGLDIIERENEKKGNVLAKQIDQGLRKIDEERKRKFKKQLDDIEKG